MTIDQESPTYLAPRELCGALAAAFRRAGEELYLVGGAVRDELLGEDDFDLDFTTSARPPQTLKILVDLGFASPYRVGEKFGTIGVGIGTRVAEITTYRSEERYAPGSRKPEVRFGNTLLEDLSRRDFTINAIARDPLTEDMIDPFGGASDLAAGLIRAIGDPADRFRDDPLRLLRAVRLAAKLRFEIHPRTWESMLQEAASLELISRERVRDEYSRVLEGPDPARGLTMLRDSALMQHSVPQLLALAAMPDHGPFHPLSLWDHTMRVVSGVPPELAVRWAALLHDIAKPATRTHEPSGRPRFFHHESVGAAIARDVLIGLRYSNQLVDRVVLLVETHMHFHSYNSEWTDGAVRRLMLRLGPLTQSGIALARSDAAAHSLTAETDADSPKFDDLEERIRTLDQESVARIASPITGNDLMQRYERPPGPWIKRVKDAICDAIVEGNLSQTDVEGAWRIAEDVLRAEP